MVDSASWGRRALKPMLRTCLAFLEAGDAIVDGGNSYYVDDIRRARF